MYAGKHNEGDLYGAGEHFCASEKFDSTVRAISTLVVLRNGLYDEIGRSIAPDNNICSKAGRLRTAGSITSAHRIVLTINRPERRSVSGRRKFATIFPSPRSNEAGIVSIVDLQPSHPDDRGLTDAGAQKSTL